MNESQLMASLHCVYSELATVARSDENIWLGEL